MAGQSMISYGVVSLRRSRGARKRSINSFPDHDGPSPLLERPHYHEFRHEEREEHEEDSTLEKCPLSLSFVRHVWVYRYPCVVRGDVYDMKLLLNDHSQAMDHDSRTSTSNGWLQITRYHI